MQIGEEEVEWEVDEVSRNVGFDISGIAEQYCDCNHYMANNF